MAEQFRATMAPIRICMLMQGDALASGVPSERVIAGELFRVVRQSKQL